jgi:hypothetical protein
VTNIFVLDKYGIRNVQLQKSVGAFFEVLVIAFFEIGEFLDDVLPDKHNTSSARVLYK